MTESMWVIIGESGEYSDRSDFIAGVFTSKDKAMHLITEKSAEFRQLTIDRHSWYRRIEQTVKRLLGTSDDDKDYWRKDRYFELNEIATEMCGPMPEGGPGLAERYYLVEVQIDQWGDYDFTHCGVNEAFK